MLLLPTVYLGNIEYYKIISEQTTVCIEAHEYYVKQSYRNRCSIYAANGKLDLIVPIVKGKKQRKIIKDTQISHNENWQKIHLRSIESAYRTSPYFEFYEEEFSRFYYKKYTWLLDLNNEINEFILSKLNLHPIIKFTEEYLQAEKVRDYRNYFNPKNNSAFMCYPYTQVFENKYGFLANLSIIDLLFNLGPETEQYLKSN